MNQAGGSSGWMLVIRLRTPWSLLHSLTTHHSRTPAAPGVACYTTTATYATINLGTQGRQVDFECFGKDGRLKWWSS